MRSLFLTGDNYQNLNSYKLFKEEQNCINNQKSMPQEVFLPEIKKLKEMGFKKNKFGHIRIILKKNEDILYIFYSEINVFHIGTSHFNEGQELQIYPHSHEELSDLISILKKVGQPM